MNQATERERHFLQTLWQNKLFECESLTLSNGTPFEIVSSGIRNSDRSDLPDFSFAAIYLPQSNVTLHGNIKIDTHSSHWREQGTVNAPEFSSVILHIVFNRDLVINQHNREVPTLVISVPKTIAEHYDLLRRGSVCKRYFGELDTVHRNHILTRIMSDRLKRKSDEVIAILNSVGGDWHETAYICFARAFGFRDKKQSFETLARTVPLRLLRLHSDSASKVDALLLGQAGYLNVPSPDNYTRLLQDEYSELQRRYTLNPRQISWRGTAVRPQSLPIHSIVRIAAILREQESLLTQVLTAQNCDELTAIFDITLSEYWQSHLAPSRPVAMGSGEMTRQKSELLIINFAIPFIAAYGIMTDNEELQDRATDLYEALPAEQNRYTREWAAGGYTPENAFFSQALIQLSSEYCTNGLCGECPLGVHQLSEKFRQ